MTQRFLSVCSGALRWEHARLAIILGIEWPSWALICYAIWSAPQ